MTKGLKNTMLIINPSVPSAQVRMGHLPFRDGKVCRFFIARKCDGEAALV